MKKSHSFLLVVVALVMGATAGWFAAGHQYSKWATSFAAADTLPNLGDEYRALQSLRTGDTNGAIEMLEFRLDSEIVALSALAAEETDAKKRASYIRALIRIRDYRVAHPRKTDAPEIDQGVANAFAWVSKEASK
ncbi:MAG: hypothetical protein WCH99_16270 [Verrucomicrobiota bacterium]